MSDDEMMVGNYQLKNCVASGSTTQIWECSEMGSPLQLAMKLMLEDARKVSAERAVLKHEFRVGSSLEHPAFLRFHDMEVNRDHAFFVMDFFRSPSLKSHITGNLVAVQSSFPKMSQALVQAFQYMHENGWLHRDIKPDNILVNKAGEIRVIDFNLAARVKGKLGLMMSGKQKNIQGTRTYIAPETILRKPATEQTDMYSLGVTFYETLTGHPPFAGDSPNDLLKKHLGESVVEPSVFNPNVLPELDAVVVKMLAKNPKDRFADMQELARTLSKIRCFQEDPLALQARKIQEEKDAAANAMDVRLDSRADAIRKEKGIVAPARSKTKRKVDPRVLREEERRLAKEAAKKQESQPQQQQAQQPPPMMPGQMPMPGMPYPGAQYPGMPMQPGMHYPGMPMQPGMPMPQMPYPGQPGMPPQGMPTQPGMPPQQQQPMPGQQPPPGQMPHPDQQQQQQQPQPPPGQQPPPAAAQQNAAQQNAAQQQQAQQQQAAPSPAPPAQSAAASDSSPRQESAGQEPEEMTMEDLMDLDIE